jgi:hypothetical protein
MIFGLAEHNRNRAFTPSRDLNGSHKTRDLSVIG